MTSNRRTALLITVPFLFPLAALGIGIAAVATNSQNPDSASSCGIVGPAHTTAAQSVTLSSPQTGSARIIYDVSASDGLPAKAAVIAIATAMQESRLENISYGTSDSLGLFQQRPSQGWGSPSEIMQPVYAAQKFYSALTAVPGWQSLPVTVAAQDVQHSGYPDAYAQWQTLADTLVSQFSGQSANCALDNGRGTAANGSTRLPSGFRLPPTTPAPVVTAIDYAVHQLGKPYIWGGTGPAGFDCSGLVMMAYQSAGITLPRTTFQQVDVGTPVYSLAQVQPGDLLFSAGSDGTAVAPGHVGMALGDGLIVEAPQQGEPVQVNKIDNGYWNRQTTAIRRIVARDLFGASLHAFLGAGLAVLGHRQQHSRRDLGRSQN